MQAPPLVALLTDLAVYEKLFLHANDQLQELQESGPGKQGGATSA